MKKEGEVLDHETFESMRLQVRCYKCSVGCIHLECGNAMLTFTIQQFRALAEVIAETQKRIQIETEPTPDSPEFVESLVM